MSTGRGAAAAQREELEQEFIAGIFERGPAAFAELAGSPFDPRWLSGPWRLAFEGAKRNVARGPLSPAVVADEIQRHSADTTLAKQVQSAIEIALEGCGSGARDMPTLTHLLADAAIAIEADQTGGLLDVAAIFAPLPPVNWLCQALDMAPGAPMLVAGYGFSGKTLAVQDLALAVATGAPVWGRFPVRTGRVLHVDYEQGSYLTRLRYQRLARARGIDPAALNGRLMLASLPRWYLDGDTADELTRLCEGIDLLIVDSFRAACPRTDENASDSRIPLDRLGRTSEATGVTPVVLHHARKPAKDAQGGARMSVRGSGALYDACGSVLVFAAAKGEPVTVAHEKARISGRPHEDFRLWIEDVEIDGDPTAGLRVSCLDAATTGGEHPSADRYSETKGRVLALLREEGAFEGGVNDLRSRLGANKDDVRAAVKELVKAGAIRKGGTYHEPVLTYVGTDRDCE